MQNKSAAPSVWWTGLLLVLLVVVPGIILGTMAIRSSDREEAFIEKQLRTALLAEVTPAVERIGLLLEWVEARLDSTSAGPAAALGGGSAAVPAAAASGASATGSSAGFSPDPLRAWQRTDSLVSVPFLFRRSGSFDWPKADSPFLSQAERDFLDLNLDFFQDRKSVEVYRNVADAYSERILDLSGKKEARMDQDVARSRQLAEIRRQQAQNEFEGNPRLQQSVYDEALKGGKNIARRSLRSSGGDREEAAGTGPSLYITESLRFSQIIGDKPHGLIPRLIDDRFELLFWKRIEGGRILGCSLNGDSLANRILLALPAVVTPVRLLTVLDHAGRPLLNPVPGEERDWRAPFVSREISGLLPRFEVAAYLSDPGVISARARSRALAVGLLVALLLVSILTGGLVVVRLMRSELRLAEQKTGFVANVSHELKTPLTSIRLFAEMLRDGRQRDPEKQRRYLGIMVSEAERLTRLINNVLDFSRLHRGGKQYNPRAVDLVELCRELTEIQQVRLKHNGFAVEFEAQATEARVWADPEAVRQVLLNLLSNAEKYSPEEKWIRLAVRREGENCVVSVEDHGVGVKPRDAKRIFEEFYRVDDSLTAQVRGTGLGLAISRRIARDNGGEIAHLPGKPKGSVFELRLPLAAAERES